LTEQIHSSASFSENSILFRIDEEINRLSKIKSTILSERLGWLAIIALFLALLLNIVGMATQATTYLVIWISASLYFYLFYPLLPLFLFPFRYLVKTHAEPGVEKLKKSKLNWARKIHIFKNKQVGFRLFIRFFIFSLLPLTIGMICIYLISMLYSIFLGNTGIIPADTSDLILIQCLGIIFFYIEIFFLRHHIFKLTQYARKQGFEKQKRYLILGIVGVIFFIVGTIIVFIFLIAILLPGFTLISFINVSEFVKVRTNIWVLLILISQVIIMQYLQNVLSLKIGRDMCDDMIKRLTSAKFHLESLRPISADGSTIENLPDEQDLMKKSLKTLRETELYAINRRQMFGLFPTYSIGIHLPVLFRINDLSELNDVFSYDE
jgi:hypothetical protein